MEELLTYREVARKLKVSERTVWGLVKAGEIRACKIGRNIRVTVEALQEYLRAVQTGEG